MMGLDLFGFSRAKKIKEMTDAYPAAKPKKSDETEYELTLEMNRRFFTLTIYVDKKFPTTPPSKFILL